MAQHLAEMELKTPFQSIALCFSGGGFRAAAFSIGVLSYLNRLKIGNGSNAKSLLNNVTFIASTSGGTIANLLYSSYLFHFKNEQTAFYKCFAKLYKEMQAEDLLEDSIDRLADDASWNRKITSKQRNAINAFAKVYDEKLFRGETFDIFWRNKFDKDFSVCFNSTEFKRGISFRFQNESDSTIFDLTGNRFIYFDQNKQEILGKIKLGDILAASSCFPSGFEPIIFPEDFAYKNGNDNTDLSVEELRNAMLLEDYDGTVAPVKESIALMDGGVADNQGLYSVMNADKRRRKKNLKAFDLVMINDVTSYFMTPYNPEAEAKKSWGQKNLAGYLGKLKNISRTFKLASVGSILFLLLSITGIVLLGNKSLLPLNYFLFGIGCISTLVFAYITGLKHGNLLIGSLLSGTKENELTELLKEKMGDTISEKVVTKFLNYIKTTKLKNLHHMLISRVNSVITMATEVNLKQVRRLIYTIFYENKRWTNRRVPNFIYELSFININSRKKRLTEIDPETPAQYLADDDRKLLLDIKNEIPRIADEARTMGTTLWFGEKDETQKKLDKIIQCGQFTTCVNLLEYTLTLIRQSEKSIIKLEATMIAELNDLKKSLEADWQQFRDKPDFFFDQEIKQIENYKEPLTSKYPLEKTNNHEL